jgi:hypothetical protein
MTMTLRVLSPADQDKLLTALACSIVDVAIATFGTEQGAREALAFCDRVCGPALLIDPDAEINPEDPGEYLREVGQDAAREVAEAEGS